MSIDLSRFGTRTVGVLMAIAFCAFMTMKPTGAQTARDSAGIRIIENAQPAWSASDALKLSTAPTLVIGNRVGEAYEFSRVAGTARLSDGRIVIADGGSLQLRFYDASGNVLNATGRRGEGPGEFRRMDALQRLPGDTLVVIGQPGTVSFLTGDGQYIRRTNTFNPANARVTGIKVVLATMSGGLMVLGTLPTPVARGSRWVDSIPLVIADRDTVVRQQLGKLPWLQMVTSDEGPRPPWFGAVAAVASDGTSFATGYGGEYSIRVYSSAGKLERIIRRRWTPVRITRADIDHYVIEWSKRWVKSTGAQAEKEKQDLRDDPYAPTVPAFSQLIADRAGRLWVREAHLLDAPGAGQFNTTPLVPSVWSVFDNTGRWLGDVTMPARFMPHDIGRDYVLGVARDSNGVETIVEYRLGRAAQNR